MSGSRETAISALLRRRGEELLKSETLDLDSFAGPEHQPASALIRDFDHHPHAFVLACVADRQVKAEIAWRLPSRLANRIGGFGFERLSSLSRQEMKRHVAKPEPLHRYPDRMGGLLFDAVELIGARYDGNAARIWSDRPSSATVVYRFLEFNGIGPKLATMAANILTREFKVPLADYYSIDISVDVHVRRVFTRLGLVPDGATAEQLIYRARALNPEFPGIVDLPCWEIGRRWCRPKVPLCIGCRAGNVCPTAREGGV